MPTISAALKSGYSLSGTEVKQFETQGWLGPYPLFDKAESGEELRKCYANFHNLLLPWPQARHLVIRHMAQTGALPQLVDRAVSLLGNDIVLWGSQVIKQQPHAQHRIHLDVENSVFEGVTFWIGLKNVVTRQTFTVIPRSHLFDISPQELKNRDGLDIRDEQAVLQAARMIDPFCQLHQMEVTDGCFIIFNGKLWHGTRNVTEEPRYAMTFQYTRTSELVRVAKNYSLPDVNWHKRRPGCILVHGEDHFGKNRLRTISSIHRAPGLMKGLLLHLPVNIARKISQRISG
jgi:hypothetical protein